MLLDVEGDMELFSALALETLTELFADVTLFPLLPFPFREGFALAPSKVLPLFALELFPALVDDKTIFRGGTFNPPPPPDLPDAASDELEAPEDFPAALDEFSLSSFSVSEWSRLCGFLGLFVAEVDPDDDDGLFLSLFSVVVEIEEPTEPPLLFPCTPFPKM